MEITKKLNIPASFFYDKVMDSVVFDVRKATGKSVTRKQLKIWSTSNNSRKITGLV